MPDSITVSINNRKYEVAGPEQHVVQATALLNKTIEEVNEITENMSFSELDKMTIVALNLSDMIITNSEGFKHQEDILNHKILDIIEHLKRII